MRISGAIVAQDAERTLGPVLDNLAAFCDEIVFVDGGSRDATVEIATSRPDVRLYRRDFDGDIGAQKSFALDQCFGEWILLLDADELLGGRGIARLRSLTRLPGLSWFSFPRYWLVEHEGGLGYLASKPWYRDRQIRLFRNLPGFRYDGSEQPIHHPFRAKTGRGLTLRGPHLFHYALLLADRATREAKVARYMEREPQSAHLNRMGLWEDADVEVRPLPGAPPGLLHRVGAHRR